MSLRKIFDGKRTAFIPYITAGDPDLGRTAELVSVLADCGADLIELGVPFSDPIADGPVNQRAAERALASGTSLARVLDFVEKERKSGRKTPFLIFTYFNPVLKMGLDGFARRAAQAGAQGALVVDLPPEEADEYRRAMGAAGLETVFLAAPTSDDERLRLIGEASTGFVYYVSRLGVTGERAALAGGLDDDLERARRITGKPVAVGFGISTPEQARAAGRKADGVIVGSALVRAAEEEGPARVRALASAMAKALEGARC